MAVFSKLAGAVTYGCNNGGVRRVGRAVSRRQTSFDPTDGMRITLRRRGVLLHPPDGECVGVGANVAGGSSVTSPLKRIQR